MDSTPYEQLMGLHEVPGHEPTVWLDQEIKRIGLGLMNGTITGCCPHITIPMVAVLWRPDCIVCKACLRDVKPADDDPENNTCDRCGDVAEGVKPLMVPTPAVWIIGGLCSDCMRKERAV